MNNEDYKVIVDFESGLISNRVSFLKERTLPAEINQKLWLLLLGLIETWDIVK